MCSPGIQYPSFSAPPMSTAWADGETQICVDDGFVYIRRKRPNPSLPLPPNQTLSALTREVPLQENQDISTLASSPKIFNMEFLQGVLSGDELSNAKPSCVELADCCNMEHNVIDPTCSLLISNKEGKCPEFKQDAPTFSDVEALIFEICFYADDQESPVYSKEASRYRHVDCKESIKLEQGACYMPRVNLSNKAFAVFFGHHLKHYIMKHKVLVGRATRESDVDIDLGKEAKSKNISRRQALIEMNVDGSFLFKNMGKCPAFINGKEMLRGKYYNLSSGCSIQIGSMTFTFEINPNTVKQYLSTAVRKKHRTEFSVFDWLP